MVQLRRVEGPRGESRWLVSWPPSCFPCAVANDQAGSRGGLRVAEDGILMKQPWITPSLFDGKPDWVVDEWTYAEFTKDNRSELERHWDTWITEQDLRAIAGAGLNTVRIPVGCEFTLPPAAYSMLAWSLARSTFFESRGSGAGEDLPVMGGWLVTRTSLVRHVQHGRLWVVPGVTDRDCLSPSG